MAQSVQVGFTLIRTTAGEVLVRQHAEGLLYRGQVGFLVDGLVRDTPIEQSPNQLGTRDALSLRYLIEHGGLRQVSGVRDGLMSVPHTDRHMTQAALQRYASAMATIQIREVPEDAYEVIRKRARASGRSIQSYMRDVVVDFAGHPTTDEVLAMMESARADSDTPGATRESVLAALAADRR